MLASVGLMQHLHGTCVVALLSGEVDNLWLEFFAVKEHFRSLDVVLSSQ